MALVELRPGDTLNIVWASIQDTPLGIKEVESSFAFSYEDIVFRLRSKGKAAKSRRSGSEGARFSRIVALASNALIKGKWSTGADIDRSDVFRKLSLRFRELNPCEYANITKNAKEALLEIYNSEGILNMSEKVELREFLKTLRLR